MCFYFYVNIFLGVYSLFSYRIYCCSDDYVFYGPETWKLWTPHASFDGQSFCACCREKGKGSDPCVSRNDCNSCNILTEEQRLQVSTPNYRLKKEKRELEKTSDTPIKDRDSFSLTDLSSVTVVGAVDDQGILQSPGSSSSTEQKKPNPTEKSKGHTSKHSKTGSEKPGKSPSIKPHRSSADARTDELDQKWSDRFNRLEAVLLSKTLDRPEPTFITVRMTPTHSPPVGAVRSTKPFIQPTDRSHVTDLSDSDHTSQRQATDKSQGSDTAQQTSTSDLPGSVPTVSKTQMTSTSSRDKAPTDRSSDLADTDSPASYQVPSKLAPARRQSTSSLDTEYDTDFSDRPRVGIFVEEGELSDQDPDVTATNPNQTLSEEQT